jgi:flagellar biosynthesis protein FlhF
MRVKRYIVDTMPEAMKLIRDELGKDAVILNQKEVRVGGFLGFNTKKKIEVIAAIDPTAQPQKPRGGSAFPPVNAARPSAPPATAPANAPTAVATAQQQLNSATAAQAYGAPKPVHPEVPVAENTAAAPVKPNTAAGKPQTEESVGGKPESVATAQTDEATDAKEETPRKEDPVLSELRQVKEMMLKLSTASRDAQQNPPAIQEMINLLDGQEVDATLIEEIMFHVKNDLEVAQISEPTADDVRALVREQLARIVYSNGVETISPDTRIVHFVGPTGVGKTTTIAKLAADQALNHKRKVGFITADTYRIAAVEQLRTYASILNAPLEVVMSPQDLNRAFENLKELDIIFMDTAGRNFRNEMYVSELNTLLQNNTNSETYLVLSMTMKFKDMRSIAENFSRIRIDRMLFSKMDETASYGSIINLIHQFSIPLSYFTHGQQVPNDITVAKEDEFVELLMGADKHD